MSTGVGSARSGQAQTSAESGGELGTRKAWVLAVCCVAQFMVILDLSIVNVALPSIQSSLGFTSIGLQWVVNAYSVFFAGFLMLGGRATDYFGLRRTFVAALSLFALASLAGGAAVDRQMLIVARGAQGLSGALMAASSLAIITSSFAPGRERHRAIGLWGAMNGAGGAAGTLIGGILTQEAGWRWVLLINPPIGIAAAVVAATVVTGGRRPGKRPGFDLTGALALTGGLIVLVYGIVTAGNVSWTSPSALVPIIAGLALLALFPVIELRFAATPLVPLRNLTRPLRAANAVVLIFSAGLFAMWYVSSLYLQQVLALSPLDTGLVFLPMALVIMLTASRAAWLVNRLGFRTVLASGLTLMMCGLLLLARIGPSGSAIGYVMVPGLLLAGGIGLAVVSSTIAATQSVGPEQAGLASGLVNTARQVGGALGIALLVSVATRHTSHLIGANQPVPNALTDGFRIAYLIGAGFVALALIVTAVGFPPAPKSTPIRARRFVMPGIVVVVVCLFGLNLATTASAGPPLGAYTTQGSYDYVSAPNLHPPRIVADVHAPPGQLATGYFLLANFYDLTTPPMDGQSGPLMVNNSLQPVWFRPVPSKDVASNLTEQTYQGRPALAWWQGVVTSTGATESGEDVVVNDHYNVVATLNGRDGWVPTLHEMKIVGNNIWVTATKNIPMNLSRYGGPADGTVIDAAVQKYNLKTGKLLYSWDALNHLPLADSYSPAPTNGFPWDAYHVNAFNLIGRHSIIISMRNLSAAYKVNLNSGKVDWTLGGKHSSFTMAPGAGFQWQHDVQLRSSSEVTLFDDACCEITGAGTYLAPNGPSRAIVLKLNQRTHRATLIKQYKHGKDFDAAYMGSFQPLANGKVLVGWGAEPYFTEYSTSGRVLLDARLPGPDLSYRATNLAHWTGLPTTRPSGAVRRTGGKTTIYASWNGATRVASWRVLGGPSASRLTRLAEKPKSGFETAIRIARDDKVWEMQALDAGGRVIGTSRPLDLEP